MNAYPRRLALAAAGIGLAGAMAACGDNVTGPATWRSDVTETITQVPLSSNSVRRFDVIAGDLLESNGSVVAGAQFRESCSRIYVGGKSALDWNCLAVVNTGPHLYVAGGHGEGIVGELPVLDDPKVGGAFFLTFDGATGPAAIANNAPRHSHFRVRIIVTRDGGITCPICTPTPAPTGP